MLVGKTLRHIQDILYSAVGSTLQNSISLIYLYAGTLSCFVVVRMKKEDPLALLLLSRVDKLKKNN